MQFAFVEPGPEGGLNRLLAEVAAVLRADGLRLAGVVPELADTIAGHPCEMDLRVLPDGPLFCISQKLGTGSRGCRLDPAGLEAAVAAVQATLERPLDLMILNKFGRHEAEGRGFCPVIAEALARGVPVLTGVTALSRAGFDAFSGGMARRLPAERRALLDWCRSGQGALMRQA